jgi:hypothetical protein
MTDITLVDGTIVDNYSKEYMLYCEAKWLLNKELSYRREWLDKILVKRVDDVPIIKGYMVLLNAKAPAGLP